MGEQNLSVSACVCLLHITNICQINRVNSRNELSRDDSTINTVPCIIIIIIIQLTAM